MSALATPAPAVATGAGSSSQTAVAMVYVYAVQRIWMGKFSPQHDGPAMLFVDAEHLIAGHPMLIAGTPHPQVSTYYNLFGRGQQYHLLGPPIKIDEKNQDKTFVANPLTGLTPVDLKSYPFPEDGVQIIGWSPSTDPNALQGWDPAESVRGVVSYTLRYMPCQTAMSELSIGS